MARMLFKWLVMSLAVLAIPQLVGGITVESFATAVAVAAVLAVLNVVLKPILILLTLPLTILSLGLFILILNAFLVQMAPMFVSGFHVDSFKSAFISSLIISLVSWVANVFDERNVRWRINAGRRGGSSSASIPE